MLKSDKYYKECLALLKNEGSYDKNPRPKWPDGTPAHSKFITQVSMSYNIDKGEFPLPTIRENSTKMGIREILAIYQTQTNTLEGFKSHNVNWWEAWMNEDGNLGKAYSYNLESDRETLTKRAPLEIRKHGGQPATHFNNKIPKNNFNEKDLLKLISIWVNIKENDLMSPHWGDLGKFLKDIRYIPQYFLARDDNFEGWVLSREYFQSDMHSPNTSVFIKKSEEDLYKVSEFRGTLSRNQIVELLNDLEFNPYSRRHIVSLYNWTNQPDKTLVECAFMNMFSVREDDKGFILDQNLIQRSSDFITASFINASQYLYLGMAICSHMTCVMGIEWRMGKFKYDINNLHCYDRHEKYIDFILGQEPQDNQPYFKINKMDDFFSLTIDDVELCNTNVYQFPKLPERLEIAE